MASSTVAMVRWPVEWAALDDMQDFAVRYCGRRYGAELVDRARIAVHELLENAVRYAMAGTEIVLELRDSGTGFDARVTNDSVESRIALLRRRVTELESVNLADAYQRALRRLLNDSQDQCFSGGLGLLRVRHEANVDLALDIVGRRVTVIATNSSVPAAAPAPFQSRRDNDTASWQKSTGMKNGKLR